MARNGWLALAISVLGCGSSETSGSRDQTAPSSAGGTSSTSAAADSGNTTSGNTTSGTSASGADTSGTSAGGGSSTATGSGGTSGDGSGGTTADSTDSSAGTTGSGSGGMSGAGAGGSSGGSGGARMTCDNDEDCGYFTCCGGYCVNPFNDPANCGTCENTCSGAQSFCRSGECVAPPCDGAECDAGTNCCGTECCGDGQLCCDVTLGPSVTACFEPEFGTCPMGCLACACASPDTPIATPAGARAISELRAGDLVYSVDHDQIRAVPIIRVNRVPVEKHRVLRLTFAEGARFEMSAEHPTADGRHLSQLRVGDSLGNQVVTSVASIPYRHAHTFDILPESETGAYFADGVLVGSTLAGGYRPDSASQEPTMGRQRKPH